MMENRNGWYRLEQDRPAGKTQKKGMPDLPYMRPREPQQQSAQRPAPPPPAQSPSPPPQNLPGLNPLPSSPKPVPVPAPIPIARTDVASAAVPVLPQEARPAPSPPLPQNTKPAPLPQRATTLLEQSANRMLPKFSETVGSDGPVLVQDDVMHETLETFVHSQGILRVVHTKGFGAFGQFQCTNSMSEFTTASIFQGPGQPVPVSVRFSLAVSNPGTPDTSRNVRGFSTKFYTQEGIFDLLCNHLPVFSVRDAIRFPESIQAFFPSPVNNLADPNRYWGFVARAPESINFTVWLYSDVGTVKSLRHLHAYSVNTYVWRNGQGARHYVKYHWIPVAGVQFINAGEAASLAAKNPNVAGQDLYDTIAAGTPVEYELRVQIMNPQDAPNLPFDPLDCTKVWDEKQYPPVPVGRMTLNRNPENFLEQTEKIAFSPSNLLDGIELSDDRMLQGRSFIYSDAQRFRLGTEFRKIPINKQENWTPANLATSGIGRQVDGTLTRSDLSKTDDFTQAGEFYRSLSQTGQEHLVENLAGDLALISAEIRQTVMGYLRNASQELCDRVAQKISDSGK